MHLFFTSLVLLLTPIGTLATFNDVSDLVWYAPFVQRAQEEGIVDGYKDETGQLTGAFGPSNNVTVAEATKMVVIASHIKDNGSRVSTENIANHWAEQYITILLQRNYDDKLSFLHNPNRPITRGELAKIITTSLRGSYVIGDIPPCYSPSQPLFIDVPFNDPNESSIIDVLRMNIMVGDGRTFYDEEAAYETCPPPTTFRPDDNVNRAEAAKVMVSVRDFVNRFFESNSSGEGYFGYTDGPRCQ